MSDKKQKNKEKKDKIKHLQQELDHQKELSREYLDQLKRMKADFENYRKRMLKESGEKFKSGEKTLATGLLYVLDNMERALEGEEIDWEGINLIKKEFFNILKTRGLEKMQASGKKFNPHYHHALSFNPTPDEEEEGLIVEVIQPGYLWEGKVLRPAQVVVAKKVSREKEDEENIDTEKGGREK